MMISFIEVTQEKTLVAVNGEGKKVEETQEVETEVPFETHPCELTYSVAARYAKTKKLKPPPGATIYLTDFERGQVLSPNAVVGDHVKNGVKRFGLKARL